MNNQQLIFNLLSFHYPEKPKTFYFSTQKFGKSTRLHKTCFPNNINDLFPGITTNGTEFIYTSFTHPTEGFHPLNINFRKENENLLRRYYNREIFHFFKKTKGLLVRKGFIGENQVWIHSPKYSTPQYKAYLKFSLKVQFNTVTDDPELQVSYDGISKVANESIKTLVRKVSATNFKWVVKDKSLYRFEELADHEDPGYLKAFPVLDNRLAEEAGIEFNTINNKTKYKTYSLYIKTLFDKYLDQPDFKEVIPVKEGGFIKVPEHLVARIQDTSNELAFNESKVGRTPKNDFLRLKPFKKCPHKNVHLFFIYAKEHQAAKDKLQECLEKGLDHYPGLTEYAGILFHTDEAMNICFQNNNTILPQVKDFFTNHYKPHPGVKYLAIYLTPFSKDETSKQEVKVYARIKEMLVERSIACQFVKPANIEKPYNGFKWSLTTMSVAILAKLNGIPWRLNTPITNELIIGIGAFRHADGVRYISSAFSFDNTGQFNEFDYFMKHQTKLLAGSIAAKVRQFASNFGNPSRIIIHFYKLLSEEELKPIEAALRDLQLPNPIPIFIITVNKTESKDIIAYDISNANPDLMPYSGTYISIGNKKYLLFNNSRFPGQKPGKLDSFPFPIKLSIDCTDKKQLANQQTINTLINQVYQFSRMYWKSLSQQNMPVTIKYAEMVAEVAPFFENGIIPEEGKNTPWFL